MHHERVPDADAPEAVGDPVVEVPDLRQRPPWTELRALALISLGGVAGASIRYAATSAWPSGSGGFPWTTFTINVVGSAVLGGLLAVLELRPSRALWRPLLGTGLIGGFTTFSTFAVDTERLLRLGEPLTALYYASGTLVVCAIATIAGDLLVRAIRRLSQRRPA